MSEQLPTDGEPEYIEDELRDLTRLQELAEDPDECVAILREDPELRSRSARADVAPQLRGWFAPDYPGGDWHVDPVTSASDAEPLVGVEWSYEGVHSEPTFDGLRATGRRVVVRGFSLFVVEDGEFRVRRYIDWMGLYAQLGLSVNWRLPIDAVPEGQAFQDVAALEAAAVAEGAAERPARKAPAKKAPAKKAGRKQAPAKKAPAKKAPAKKAAAKKAGRKKAGAKRASRR